jgi:hypothetical protein
MLVELSIYADFAAHANPSVLGAFRETALVVSWVEPPCRPRSQRSEARSPTVGSHAQHSVREGLNGLNMRHRNV